MSMLALGLLFGGVTLVVMFSGMPIAFALGFVAILFMFAVVWMTDIGAYFTGRTFGGPTSRCSAGSS